MDWSFVLLPHWTSCGDSHTPPRTRPSGISYMHQYNTIMIKASTCNNLISVHLYVYNDKFFPLPTHTLLIDLSSLAFPSLFFLSFHYRTQQATPHRLITVLYWRPQREPSLTTPFLLSKRLKPLQDSLYPTQGSLLVISIPFLLLLFFIPLYIKFMFFRFELG